MDGVNPGHDIIDLPSLQLSLIVPEDELTGSVDLIHDPAIFPIKLKKNDSMFLIQTSLVASKDLLFLVVFYLQLVGLLQDFQAFLLIIEHFNEILRVEIVALNALELPDHLPGLVYFDLHGE